MSTRITLQCIWNGQVHVMHADVHRHSGKTSQQMHFPLQNPDVPEPLRGCAQWREEKATGAVEEAHGTAESRNGSGGKGTLAMGLPWEGNKTRDWSVRRRHKVELTNCSSRDNEETTYHPCRGPGSPTSMLLCPGCGGWSLTKSLQPGVWKPASNNARRASAVATKTGSRFFIRQRNHQQFCHRRLSFGSGHQTIHPTGPARRWTHPWPTPEAQSTK